MSTAINTKASDYARLHFHAITEWHLPLGACTTCWTEVVSMLSEMATPAEILAAPHACTGDWDCAQILARELTLHPEKW